MKEEKTVQVKVKKARPNPRWTFVTALAYVMKKAVYHGLTYWSAMDYLSNYHANAFKMAMATEGSIL